MPSTTAPDLTPEDVAHFADASDELPDDTAVRLQAFICCDDPEQVHETWRLIRAHLEALRQMAEDAGVELLVDAIFIFRIFEQLRSETWESPGEVLLSGIDVPYRQVISMAGAHAERAEGTERAELLRLRKRLIAALGQQLGGGELADRLIDRLLEVGEEAAEETLSHLLEVYRQRREGATSQEPVANG